MTNIQNIPAHSAACYVQAHAHVPRPFYLCVCLTSSPHSELPQARKCARRGNSPCKEPKLQRHKSDTDLLLLLRLLLVTVIALLRLLTLANQHLLVPPHCPATHGLLPLLRATSRLQKRSKKHQLRVGENLSAAPNICERLGCQKLAMLNPKMDPRSCV